MTVHFGPLVLQALHVVLLGAFAAALLAGYWAGRKAQVKVSSTLFDMALGALVAARIVFVALWFEQYRQAPLSILDISDGGFNVWGALAGAAAVGLWRTWRRRELREPLLVSMMAGVAAGLLAGAPSLLRMEDRKTVPALMLATPAGKAVALDQIAQGKPMVVNLWATWCPPCRREMPILAEAQRRNPQAVFVFASQGEDAETVSAYVSKHQPGLRNVLLDSDSAAGLSVSSRALPTTLFYDASGTLVERHIGPLSGATLAAKMARILPAAPSGAR